jgi:hypothetical protein
MVWWKRSTPKQSTLDPQVRAIAEARSVAFGGVGFASQILPETEAYFALEERLAAGGEALRSELERLLDEATPAGRVYAAELLSRIDRAAGEAAWRRLSTDRAQLDTMSGCLPHRTTVAQYAADRLAAA